MRWLVNRQSESKYVGMGNGEWGASFTFMLLSGEEVAWTISSADCVILLELVTSVDLHLFCNCPALNNAAVCRYKAAYIDEQLNQYCVLV